MASARAAASKSFSAFQELICWSSSSLSRALRPNARIASLDVTQSHISIAISDRERQEAAPFGVFMRSASAASDARIIASVLRQADSFDAAGSIDIGALIVGVARDNDLALSYTRDLLEDQLRDAVQEQPNVNELLFPDLSAIMFYCEAHAVRASLESQETFLSAVKFLPTDLETRKLKRFTAAMNPVVSREEFTTDRSSRARISASEILQVVLDDLQGQ